MSNVIDGDPTRLSALSVLGCRQANHFGVSDACVSLGRTSQHYDLGLFRRSGEGWRQIPQSVGI
jgi:hypothetical protein